MTHATPDMMEFQLQTKENLMSKCDLQTHQLFHHAPRFSQHLWYHTMHLWYHTTVWGTAPLKIPASIAKKHPWGITSLVTNLLI